MFNTIAQWVKRGAKKPSAATLPREELIRLLLERPKPGVVEAHYFG